jgi:hypothetical protein
MLGSLLNRLKRLQRRVDPPRETVSLWDVLAGVAPPERLPPEVLAVLEAAGSSPGHDRVDERMAAALREPCGLRELQTALPGTEPPSSEPAPALNRLGGKPSRGGDGQYD